MKLVSWLAVTGLLVLAMAEYIKHEIADDFLSSTSNRGCPYRGTQPFAIRNETIPIASRVMLPIVVGIVNAMSEVKVNKCSGPDLLGNGGKGLSNLECQLNPRSQLSVLAIVHGSSAAG